MSKDDREKEVLEYLIFGDYESSWLFGSTWGFIQGILTPDARSEIIRILAPNISYKEFPCPRNQRIVAHINGYDESQPLWRCSTITRKFWKHPHADAYVASLFKGSGVAKYVLIPPLQMNFMGEPSYVGWEDPSFSFASE